MQNSYILLPPSLRHPYTPAKLFGSAQCPSPSCLGTLVTRLSLHVSHTPPQRYKRRRRQSSQSIAFPTEQQFGVATFPVPVCCRHVALYPRVPLHSCCVCRCVSSGICGSLLSSHARCLGRHMSSGLPYDDEMQSIFCLRPAPATNLSHVTSVCIVMRSLFL